MRQIKRFTAFLLCLLMILPTQELTVLAETMSAEHVQIEEMLSTEPMEDGSGSIEETQKSEESEKSEEESENAGKTLSSETSGTSEDGADRIKDTLPLEPVEDGADRIKETLPLEPVEDGTDRIKETLPLEPVEDGTDRIKETLPLEPVEDGTDRIKETLPLEVIKTGIDHIKKTLQLEPLEEDGYAIYWNPGDQLPIELATASNALSTAISNTSLTAASKASSKVSSTASDAASSDAVSSMPPKGRDTANGLSPAKPVKTLAKALERAKKLMKKKGLEPSDITIYAMNPMEIADGELYALNAGNIRIASWPDRPYENDALFYVNGGQLTLMNVQLEAEEPDREPDETELVYVRGGVLQIGQNVNINGRVIMDYRSDEEDTMWKKSVSTSSDASKAKEKARQKENQEGKEKKTEKTEKTEKTGKSGKSGSNISKYDIDPGEENIKLLKEKKSTSTWRDPIIELMDGFDGGSGEYLLEVKDDGEAESRELVTTLYTDDTTEEEFLGYFALAESDEWNLEVETAAVVQVRDTGSEDTVMFRSFDLEEETLTSKTLFASRSLTSGTPVYWNPGPGINVGGMNYPQGNDNNDGTRPGAPLKTWEKAAENARKELGGIVVAMQSLNLGDTNAADYLPQNGSGEFYIESQSQTLITSLTTWNSSAQPAIIVPENKTLIVENLFLDGRYDGGNGTEAPTILVDKGNLIVKENVKTEEKGYIQLNASSDLKEHPIQICSVEAPEDGDLRLFFSGINESIEYRYTDVAVPGGALKESIEEAEDQEARAIIADSIGWQLFNRLELYIANRNVVNGGLSKFDWSLRQDTNEDDNVINAQNIELYTDYYFNAIYIDGVRGDDNNYGATCAYPVKTWDRAKAIWQREMARSLQARQAEVDAGTMFWEEIIEKYPMPEVIYICDTVTVSDAESWELEPCYDPVRKMNIVTEVRSHIDGIAIQEENGGPLHEAPKTMIEVTETGVLDIHNVFIRNMTDDTASVTIKVKGALNLEGDTTLSGTRVDSTSFSRKTFTLGNHVTVTRGGRFVMKTNWTGSIENKEQGVVAVGSGTAVEMNGGSIQKNNSYRTDYYNAGRVDHKAGSGVALSDGARFTMNGGEITQNQSYQYGAGVYLTDAGTSFIMKKGKVSDNKLLETYVSMTNRNTLFTQGVGIYAGTGTIVEIGDETSDPEDTLISNNKAYLAYGTGIYADGSLSIKNASVSDNESGGSTAIASAINCGVGIYIGANGILTMDGGLVKGNRSNLNLRGDAKGAGIYIGTKTNSSLNSHTITRSIITENETGYELNYSTATTTSQGGGIYLADGNTLTITDTTVSNNKSACGGGIYAAGSSERNVTLTLERTVIEKNKGRVQANTYYGEAGGIYFYGYGNLTLKDGTKIIDNSAVQRGGGIYMNGVATGGSFVSMMGSEPEAIEISGNKTDLGGDGGGVYHYGITWGAENVLIHENEASLGGGIYSSNGSYGYFKNVEISENRASNGAGVMLNGANHYYMQDSSIVNNTAYNNGGGINLASTSAAMFLTETTDGAFKLSGNHADYGGGIAISSAATFMMDIAGPIKNSAAKEGSNFYLGGAADLSILNGAFKQPDEIAQVEGVHNIYIDDTTTSSKKKYFDFSKVTVEKKEGNEPDVIFLNSGNSFLTVLAAPPNADYSAFPIDLNTKAFGTGSVVLKPGGISYYTTQVVYKPNAGTSGIVTETKTYPNLLDATENLNYYRGGKLPRRNDLGGFKDSQESNKINVVLIAQGVYLDGENGNDSNDGSSPERAVKTFERAKTYLESRIINTLAEDIARLDDDEREGYAPFIYICGQVSISQSAVWELDYNNSLYKETNKYYAIAEVRNEAPVYEAQVRRFASFVDKPMILVSGSVPFTLKRLIIDGMADKVVLADQGANSPVIRANANSTVTLNGDSMITNNYNNVLMIYGKLLLTGEERDMNKQLYNNPAEKIVNLFASAEMKMEGYARIITESAEENVFSGVAMSSVAVYTANTAVKVSMEDHSAIIQGSNPIVSSNYVIQSSYSDFTFEMKDAAKIEIDTAVAYPIYSSGANAIINMSDNASLVVLEKGSWMRGIQLQNNSSLTMSDQANITYGGIVDNLNKYAVYLAPASSAKATVTMKDNAEINYSNNTSYAFGIYVSTGTGSGVNLSNNAKIIGSNGGGGAGIYVGSTATAVQILLNMEEDGSEEESASIMNMSYGIYMPATTNTARTTLIAMGKKALITGCSNGMYLADIATLTTVNIVMKDYSRISKSDAVGICLYRDCRGLVNIRMEDYAAIEQSAVGISEPEVNGSAYYNAWHLDITMSEYARISGNDGAGIQLAGLGNWSESTGYQKITLYDNAMIGGDNYYSGEAAASGNQKAGIYASGPIEVNLYGNSKISGNGMLGGMSEGADSGIYLIRRKVSNSFDRYRPGTAKITLYDESSICNNRGSGVYGSTIVDSTATYHNEAIIELNGINEEGIFSSPSIQGNTAPLYLGTDTTLKLKGFALVRNGDNGGWAVNNYGLIKLDGRSRVDGLIYMEDSERPITMTHAVDDPLRRYDLHLTEGFAGKSVVKPDGVGIHDLTATGTDGSQLAYFNKVSADGMAASRPIVELRPDLVLLGENNVYLSGSGNDNYAGNTPTTAVRTFKKARDLLRGAGYYTAGANIIICRSEVTVLEDDIDWSFDAGGYVTNSLSGDHWKPLVIRDTEYSGNLIVLRSTSNSSTPLTATFKNITIDGGSENGITLGIIADNSLLKVESGKTAILGEGAVLQNNKAVVMGRSFSYNTAMGVVVLGGTLEINGGIIQNMVRETNYGLDTDLFASAVAVQGYNSYPAKLIMRSGQILNNELKSPLSRSTDSHVGTILLGTQYSSMEMSGGLIENNKVTSMDSNPAAAGAVVNYNGSVTISGGMIRGNEGGRGSAIFHYSDTSASQLIFSGGQIGGNRTNVSGKQSVGSYAPIYIARNGMELRGGSANISDGIYLNRTEGVIKVSDHIYQTGRSYRIYFEPGKGATEFKKGSVVVQPDGNRVTDVTSYLPYFDVRSNPYVLDQGRTDKPAGTVAGVKENQCLLLMQAIYLDSGDGLDTNDGSKPSKAVKTFTKAREIGDASTHGDSKHYVIYVCGNAASNTTNSENLWTLPETAYLCRYTGFPVYESDGTDTQELERAYYGYLIDPKFNLTFQDIGIQGRRGTDSTESNGDSLVKVSSGIQVTVDNGAVFSNNYNNGNYIAEDELVDSLSSKGGAFQVKKGGSLTVKGGRIEGNRATYGDAIYLEADANDPSSIGQLHLSGPTVQPVISGSVYLDGTGSSTSAYIKTEASYAPSAALQISIGNDFNGRPVVSYTDSTEPGEDELKYYKFDDAIYALYDIANRESDPHTLELNLRKVIYLDGQAGSEEVDQDGLTPETAFKTLKQTFEAIGNQPDTKGVLVFVVGTVNIAEGTGEPSDVELMNVKVSDTSKTSHYEGFYKDGQDTVPIRGQVFFRRYSQPRDYEAGNSVYDGYNKETLYDSLFYIKEDGKLTLDGIYLDGHSVSTDSINPTLKADAVEAKSPLVTVEGTGTLECKRADGVSNAVATETLFTNNVNGNGKTSVIGQLEGVPMNEGSSAGIELLAGGTAVLEGVRFSNLSLGSDVAAGGTDVYNDGTLSVSYKVNFSGSVFLEGLGTKDNVESHETSRFLTVKNYGSPVEDKFQVLMRDPYMGRDVVHYPEGTSDEPSPVPGETDIGYFLLEARVKEFFYLTNRSENPWVLELQTPVAIYIDGAIGRDNQEDRVAGSTPRNPIKTLRRAFELLKTRSGDTIYVVNTIQVDGDIQVAGMPGEMSYRDAAGSVLLGSTNKVKMVRYIQPDFAQSMSSDVVEAGYDVLDFRGVLLNIKPGVSAQFSTNVYFDGHSEPKADPKLPKEMVVTRFSDAKAPLITVEKGGTLNLLSDVTLYNNNNTYDPDQDSDENGRYKHGGAIYNSGTTTVDGALFKDNKAKKGSVVYQDGTFTILSAPEKLADNPNAFYLTTENKGTGENPVWGVDHVLQTAVAIPANQVFDIDLDRREKGRDVVRFTNSAAYDPNADAEHDHFRLASTVPAHLFLVEAENDPDVLELQDWEILKVEVPADIYLVVRRNGSYENTTRLMGVMSDSPAGAGLFTAPEYMVKNKGLYDAKVSITGFENKTAEEITADPNYLMNLAGTSAAAAGENDLYLAVKGLDDTDTSGGTGFGTIETSLQPYTGSTVTEEPLVLGTLKSQDSGRFTFIGSVGSGFVDKYMDSTFPVEGASGADVQKYMDGDSGLGTINARAKYLMKYKVEIVPSRRIP